MDINLRRPRPADAPALRRIYSSPKVAANTWVHTHMELETWRQHLSEIRGGARLVAQVGDEVVGHAELNIHGHDSRRAHAAEFTLAVRDDWQRRGIGRALLQECLALADNWLHVLRIELTVWPDNAAAIGLHESHGFIHEGRLRSYAQRNGGFGDVLAMARLHPWQPSIRSATAADGQ